MRRLAGDDPEVNEEWNCDKGRFAFRYARADDRLTTPLVRDDETGELRPGVVARGVRASRPAAWRAAARLGRRADRRPADRRGRLRLRKFARVALGTNDIDFRARAALRRGGRLPRRARRRPRPSTSTYADLEQRQRRAAGRLRARGRVADRVPAAAQGRPQARHQGRLDRAVHLAAACRRCTARWSAPRPATRPAAARGAGRTTATSRLDGGGVILVGERLATVPGALSAAARAGRDDRRQAGLGAAACRRAGRARDRLPAQPAARRPPGRRRRRPGRPRHGLGSHRPARRRAATPTRSSPPRRRASSAALVVGGVDPDDLPDPAAAARRARARRRSWSASRSAASAVTDARRRGLPGRPGRREGRHVRRLGGPGPAVRQGARASPTRCPTCGCSPASPTSWASTSGFRTVDQARGEMHEIGAWDGPRAACAAACRGRSTSPPHGRRRGGARDLEAADRRRPDARRRDVPRGHRAYGGRAGVRRRRWPGSALAAGQRVTRHRRRRLGRRCRVGVADLPDGCRLGADAPSHVVAARVGSLAASGVAAIDRSGRMSTLAPCVTRRRGPLRLRQRPLVGGPGQGAAGLRDPGGADAVQHLVRAPGRGPDAAPHRPQRARPLRPAAVASPTA